MSYKPSIINKEDHLTPPKSGFLNTNIHQVPLQQSPKISSCKFRKNSSSIRPKSALYSVQEQKHPSILDVDLRRIQKGTEFPFQFKRPTTENKSNNTNHKEPSEQHTPSSNKTQNILRASTSNPQIQKRKLRNDRYLPKDFQAYNDQFFNRNFANNYVYQNFKCLPPKLLQPNLKELKLNSNKSDIFNRNIQAEDSHIKHSNMTRYLSNMSSDIFNQHPSNELDRRKTGEKFLYNSPQFKGKYNISNESGSSWQDKKNDIIKKGTLNSKPYSIIAPNIKNYYNSNKEINQPNNKTKAMSEFVVICSQFNPNYNQNYQMILKENKGSFNKVHQMCTDFYDSYGPNKNLLERPFINKKK